MSSDLEEEEVESLVAAEEEIPPAVAEVPELLPQLPTVSFGFFVPHKPTSNEHSKYFRADLPYFWTTRSFTWVWRFSSVLTPLPRARFVIDGQVVTDWVTPVDWFYTFNLVNVPNGHHIGGVEVEGVDAQRVMWKAFVVNDTGRPLEDQRPWTATNRFETRYGPIQVAIARASYPPKPPKIFRMTPRVVEPYNTRLPKTALWVRNLSSSCGAALTRRFATIPTGDVVIAQDQKYFYSTAVTIGSNRAGLEPPKTTIADGVRGIGTHGHIYKIIIRRGGKMLYFSETTGRFGAQALEDVKSPVPPGTDMRLSAMRGYESEVATFGGWRVPEGKLNAHSGLVHTLYQYGNTSVGPAHQKYYNDQWEHVGDWSRVRGSKRFHEPWGFCIARRMPDGSIDTRDGLEWWHADTLNHRLLYSNTWTAHPAFYRRPYFPPAGYTAPPAPTGEVQLVTFLDTPDGLPNAFLNEPWDCEIRKQDGKIYWTNFAGNSICRANLDGSKPEVVLKCSMNPTNAELGIWKRLAFGRSAAALRITHVKDGPVGVATCVRPQAMGFFSDGKLCWVERYTYVMRELDLETMTVRTLAAFPKIQKGSTSAGTNDIAMCIDVEGTTGPKDDVYLNAWHSSDWRFSREGEYLGQWKFVSGADVRNGPLDRCSVAGYSWGIGVGDGKIITTGNAGGSQWAEITKRLPTDPTPDVGKLKRGSRAYVACGRMYLLHGPKGQAALGYPTFEEMGTWTDAKLHDYARGYGMPEAALADFTYYVHWHCIDIEIETEVHRT